MIVRVIRNEFYKIKVQLLLHVLIELIGNPVFTMDNLLMGSESNINNNNLNNIHLSNNINENINNIMDNSINNGESNIDSKYNINERNSNIDLGNNNNNIVLNHNVLINNIQISEQDIKKYKTKLKELNSMINDCEKRYINV